MLSVVNVILASEEDANVVRDALRKLLNLYEVVTVADYLELVGSSSSTFADQKVGWTELGDIPIARTKDAGFVLDLPEPKTLDVPRSAFPFLKGWWIVVDVPGDQVYEGKLIDELGGTMILEVEPSKRHGIAMSTIKKIDAYRERPTPQD